MNALDLAYAIGGVVSAPWWARKSRAGWAERLGRIEAVPAPPAGRKRVLLHAVSVGEVNAIRGLVPLLDRHVDVVIAATTDTGLARARELFAPRHAVRRYPLDLSGGVARFLDAVRPDLAVLVELEVWPNFIGACAQRGIGVGIINGRLSERSFRGYRRFRRIVARMFAPLTFVCAQEPAYRDRFLALGVRPDRVRVSGSMKWDSVSMAEHIPGANELAREMGIRRDRPLIVAGSTGPWSPGTARSGLSESLRTARDRRTEEALLHAACPEGVQLLCAPRKPERFEEAASSLPGVVRRSDRPGGTRLASGDRFLLDTLGELRAAYSLATVAVVGRSFGGLYGSDVIEPIALGIPTIIGPYFGDFESIVRSFEQGGGIIVADAADLPKVLRELLGDEGRRRTIAAAGRRVIETNRGATARHAREILGALGVGATIDGAG